MIKVVSMLNQTKYTDIKMCTSISAVPIRWVWQRGCIRSGWRWWRTWTITMEARNSVRWGRGEQRHGAYSLLTAWSIMAPCILGEGEGGRTKAWSLQLVISMTNNDTLYTWGGRGGESKGMELTTSYQHDQ